MVAVEFANDPDICIREKLPSGNFRNLVAVEIKGGKDDSNIHNLVAQLKRSEDIPDKTESQVSSFSRPPLHLRFRPEYHRAWVTPESYCV